MDVKRVIEKYIQDHREVPQYSTCQQAKKSLIDSGSADCYGGITILNQPEVMELIREFLNMTIVVCDMTERNEPAYAIRKTIDCQRDKLWKQITENTEN